MLGETVDCGGAAQSAERSPGAQQGKAVELTRRGKPVAVLIGHRMFSRLAAGRRGFANAYREFTQDVDLAEVGLDPDVIFKGVRASTPGRNVPV